MKIEIYHNIE